MSDRQFVDLEAAMSLAILATIYFVIAVGLVLAIDYIVGIMYGASRADYPKASEPAKQTAEH